MGKNALNRHRPAVVAGTFYPGSPAELAHLVTRLLSQAEELAAAGRLLPPKALIVPHAGYIYSGSVAAVAYACLASLRHTISRVVLLGPAHRLAVYGLALPNASAFDTPLGSIPIDIEFEQVALQLPQVSQNEAAHALEHSLEVQLPFLQTTLGHFTLLPLAVGMASNVEVAEVLDCVWGGPETLIVISSDLSHFHSYAEAHRRDSLTVQQIMELKQLADYDQACGAIPINGLLLCAKGHGLKPRLLDLRNSGDTAGDRASVVGYCAFAFSES